MYITKIIIIILGCVVFAVSQQHSIETQWHVYSPTDKNFTIEFPSKPVCTTEKIDIQGSKINLTKCLTNISEKYFFEMKHMVYPFDLDKDSLSFMKIPITSVYEALDMKVTEIKVMSDSCEGIEIRANSAEGGPSSVQRLFVYGRNFYSINLATEKSDSTFKNFHGRFLSSFQISKGCKSRRK